MIIESHDEARLVSIIPYILFNGYGGVIASLLSCPIITCISPETPILPSAFNLRQIYTPILRFSCQRSFTPPYRAPSKEQSLSTPSIVLFSKFQVLSRRLVESADFAPVRNISIVRYPVMTFMDYHWKPALSRLR